MSVRRRLLGSVTAFAAAVVVTSAAHAQFPPRPVGPQPPFGGPAPFGGGPPVSKDQVQAALERLGARFEPGAPKLPFDPALLEKLFANPDPKREPTPADKARAEELLKNPFIKQLAEEMIRRKQAQPGSRPEPGPGPAPPDGVPMPPPGVRPPPNDPRVPPVGPAPKQLPDGPAPVAPKVAPPDRIPPKVAPPDRFPPPFDKARLLPDGEPVPPPPVAVPPQPPQPQFPWQQEAPQDKARQALAAVWENNIGPLNQTPEVKKALFDIIDGSGDFKDADGNSLWDSFAKEFGDGKSFADLFNGAEGFDPFGPGGGWEWPDWEMPKFNWNFNWGNGPDVGPDGGGKGWFDWLKRPSSSSSSSSSSGGGSSWFSGWKAPNWNIGIPALDGTWLPVVFVVLALVGGIFLWRYLAKLNGRPAGAIDPYALGPWPVDPHRLATRQDVVVAFEHLSVLLCGPAAKTWTHTTIAAALTEFALADPARAMLLARLYELARYTPVEEPLTTHELAEARLIVCRLAGLGDE